MYDQIEVHMYISIPLIKKKKEERKTAGLDPTKTL